MTGSDKELKSIFNELNRDAIRLGARRMNIEWDFNPPKACHMAGATERMIRTVRRVLQAVLNVNDRLNDETLETIFCEVENIINSRPLTKCSEDPLDDKVITPNHILLLHGNHAFPWSRSDKSCTLRYHWKHAQFAADQFWRKWLKYYIPELYQRQKWLKITPNLQVGDVCLLMDQITGRGVYPMGRVIEINLGRDKLVRSVRLQTKSTQLVRPIHKLVLLEGKLYDKTKI